ncbi:hypothetical protein NP233_g1143 [Leucocoprinus birnbaumii]|uniref:Nephrocystin 3-like N-terminal domain-containing protein n=1 Tax=Leucocoprinus birnbaumii TaxID=56174 RepID=A0AAD5W3F7_9AGAR|nr:hypothetical protein NP233_g1143 [Leucocoprinus birnbaumii]
MMRQTNAESSLDTIRPELFQGARDFMINNPTFVSYGSNEDRLIDILANSALAGAAFDSSERDPPPSCHPGTRLDLSDEIHTWAHNITRVHKILWINGPAGVGKSAIVQSISELESALENSILGATLFFSRANCRDNPKRVFTTIAYQLAVKYPHYREYVLSVLALDPHAVYKSMAEQFMRLIVQPVIDETFPNDQDHRSILISIDGLDECDGERAQCEIISLIARFVIQYPTCPFIWLIASRPEPHIRGSFDRTIRDNYTQIVIPVDSNQGCKDVEQYLRDKFDEIRSYYPSQFSQTLRTWPAEIHFTILATRAKGMFVFASTLVNFIGDTHFANPIGRLQTVLAALTSVTLTNTNPFAELDALYDAVLTSVPEENLPTLRRLLAPLIFVRAWRPNREDVHFVCNFWGITQADAFSTLHKLHSVIRVPQTCDKRLQAYHASFHDYLANPSRSGHFYIDPDDLNQQLHQCAERILTESCMDATSPAVSSEQVHLSWPFEPERAHHTLQHQNGLLEASFQRIVNCYSAGWGDGFVRRLSRFFHVFDWGKAAKPRVVYDTIWSAHLVVFQQPFCSIFREWGLVKTLPLPAFDLRDLRREEESLAFSVMTYNCDTLEHGYESGQWTFRHGTDPSCVFRRPRIPAPHQESPYPGAPWANKCVTYQRAEFCLTRSSQWEARLENHLAYVWRRNPPHRIYILGKGAKACALIWLVEDDRAWYYMLPYVEPRSEP